MINLFPKISMVERLRLSKYCVLREILLFVAQYIMCCALINSIECQYLDALISRIMPPISDSSPWGNILLELKKNRRLPRKI